ncbi:MAG: ATP-dependent DNA helicase DinG, partial [Spirochaetaceae bacterium]|nr:ATP-dependent DNA helicase DinG [Spirochaetaceae bacterium]
IDIKAAIVKGRGNFLCLRHLEDTVKEHELAPQSELFDEAETAALAAITDWAEKTETGEKSELPFVPPPSLWSRLASESDSCMAMRCPCRPRCFVMAARKEAESAALLVVNHHLLFADLAARYEGAGYDGTVVLPPYRRVIIDEAHKIEASATSFFSHTFGRPALARSVGRLYRRRGAQESGLLVRLRRYLPPMDDGGTPQEDFLSGRILSSLEELNAAGLDMCGNEAAFRFIVQRDGIIQQRLIPPLNNLCTGLTALIVHVEKLIQSCGEGHEPEAELSTLIWEAKSVLRGLHSAAQLCQTFICYQKNPGRILWIERRAGNRSGSGQDTAQRGRRNDWALWTSAPLEVGPVLAEALFKPNKTVSCVSATLSVAGNFGYWQDRIGLSTPRSEPDWNGTESDGGAPPPAELLTGVFPSPFPYKQTALLAVPARTPLPNAPDYQTYINDAILRLCTVSGGGALVLFTSYESLRTAYAFGAEPLKRAGITPLQQGDDDRSRLMSRFVRDESSVLFATDSFWEGIDAPGQTLRLVIICRLPFVLPEEPVMKARCEALEQAGRNAFMELSLPEAVMKFRQGFGRLIRRATDRGVVAVLDTRIVQKPYGRLFFASLPETRRVIDTFAAVERAVESFLNC